MASPSPAVLLEYSSRIKEELDKLESFEKKSRYLDQTLGKSTLTPRKLMAHSPDIKQDINSYMIKNIADEFGNPEDPGFTFSKEYSDKFLLDKLELIDKNQQMYEDYFGGEEGITELEESYRQRNAAYTEASEKVLNLRDAIFKRRREFDARSEAFGGPAGVFTVPMQAMKPVIQWAAGWTDWFQDEGLEMVENRKLDWDPANKRYGPGPEIPALQAELREAYEEKTETVPRQYLPVSDKYKEYIDMERSDKHNRNLINSTGIDEALRFLDVESLKPLLQGN